MDSMTKYYHRWLYHRRYAKVARTPMDKRSHRMMRAETKGWTA